MDVLVRGPDQVRVRSPLRRGAIRFIETYRSDVSGRIGASCRFETSCSQYGLNAFRRHTFPVATAMTLTRLGRCHEPVSGRRVGRALGALAALVGAIVAVPLLMGTALAQVQGPCTATLAGVDAATASTPDDAIEVQHDAQVPATGTMSSGPVSYKVQLEFAGARWTAKSGTSSGNTWQSTVDVAKYAKYGVGIYKVHATSTNAAGEKCTVDGYVKVVGKSPLTTVAGVVGGVALVGGLALTGAATAKAAKPIAYEADYVSPPVRQVQGEMIMEVADTTQRFLHPSNDDRWFKPKCSLMSFWALLLTTSAILNGRGRRG